VADDDQVIGDDPFVDGMDLSVRLRLDFSVTDAGQFLTAAWDGASMQGGDAAAAGADLHLPGVAITVRRGEPDRCVMVLATRSRKAVVATLRYHCCRA
jgi:hypothetical protein